MEARKRRRLTQRELLESEARCVYCESTGPFTLEHMPPRSMFKDRRRPKGMEFAACSNCNNGTRAVDALMAMIARMGTDETRWKIAELESLAGAVSQLAPEAFDEIANAKGSYSYVRGQDGYYRKVFHLDVKGKTVAAYVAAFATKLGMACFRHLTGQPLPRDGLVWTHWVFNGGMTPGKLEAMTSIMPSGATLSQGKVEVSDQFYYRFNSDDRTTVAVTAAFQGTLFMMAIVSSEPMIVEGLRNETRLFPSAIAGPGGLADLMAGGGPRGHLVSRIVDNGK